MANIDLSGIQPGTAPGITKKPFAEQIAIRTQPYFEALLYANVDEGVKVFDEYIKSLKNSFTNTQKPQESYPRELEKDISNIQTALEDVFNMVSSEPSSLDKKVDNSRLSVVNLTNEILKILDQAKREAAVTDAQEVQEEESEKVEQQQQEKKQEEDIKEAKATLKRTASYAEQASKNTKESKLKKFWDKVKPFLLIGLLAAFRKQIWDAVTDFWEKSGLKDTAENFFKKFTGWLKKNFPKVYDTLQDITKWVKQVYNRLEKIWDKIIHSKALSRILGIESEAAWESDLQKGGASYYNAFTGVLGKDYEALAEGTSNTPAELAAADYKKAGGKISKSEYDQFYQFLLDYRAQRAASIAARSAITSSQIPSIVAQTKQGPGEDIGLPADDSVARAHFVKDEELTAQYQAAGGEGEILHPDDVAKCSYGSGTFIATTDNRIVMYNSKSSNIHGE